MTHVRTSTRYHLGSGFNRAIACLIAFIMLTSHSMGVIAQSIPDIEAPLIELEFVDSAPADAIQVFTVQAVDDIGLGDVSLHHRRAGESAFVKSLMVPIGDTGFFSIEITSDPGDLRAYEYYVQALDLNGNRTVSGFAFDPFVRKITEAENQNLATGIATEATPGTEPGGTVSTPTTETSFEQPTPKTNNNRRWLYIALGVLAAGAAASQLGGGGSDRDDTASDTVPLTVNIGNPIP